MEALKLDVWTWLHGNDPGFTFQSAQLRQTWSWLDRMYVMHNDSFLPPSLNMKVVTWNVRGACSPHKKYILWETFLSIESLGCIMWS